MAKKKFEERIRGFYAGSFDPLTRGHMDVICKAAPLFDNLFVGVMTNPAKTPMFSAEDRTEMIRQTLIAYELHNVRVVKTTSLATVREAKLHFCRYLIRGIRLTSDFESELFLAFNNREIDPEIQTIFIPPSQATLQISSSAVRELLRLGEWRVVERYLPAPVLEYFEEKGFWHEDKRREPR